MNFSAIISDTTFIIIAFVVFAFTLGVIALLARTPRDQDGDEYSYDPIAPVATERTNRDRVSPALDDGYGDEHLSDRVHVRPSRPWPRFTVTRAPRCDEPMGYEAAYQRSEYRD